MGRLLAVLCFGVLLVIAFVGCSGPAGNDSGDDQADNQSDDQTNSKTGENGDQPEESSAAGQQADGQIPVVLFQPDLTIGAIVRLSRISSLPPFQQTELVAQLQTDGPEVLQYFLAPGSAKERQVELVAALAAFPESAELGLERTQNAPWPAALDFVIYLRAVSGKGAAEILSRFRRFALDQVPPQQVAGKTVYPLERNPVEPICIVQLDQRSLVLTRTGPRLEAILSQATPEPTALAEALQTMDPQAELVAVGYLTPDQQTVAAEFVRQHRELSALPAEIFAGLSTLTATAQARPELRVELSVSGDTGGMEKVSTWARGLIVWAQALWPTVQFQLLEQSPEPLRDSAAQFGELVQNALAQVQVLSGTNQCQIVLSNVLTEAQLQELSEKVNQQLSQAKEQAAPEESQP